MVKHSFALVAGVALVAAVGIGCNSKSSTPSPAGGGGMPEAPDIEIPSSPTGPGETPSASSSDSTELSGWGSIKGRFVYKGDPPEQAKINVTKDIEYCSKHNPVDESLVVNAEDKGLANVVIWLRDKPSEIHPSYADAAKEKAVLDNKFCRFEPHVCTMQAGQTLEVKNSDEVGHNTKIDCFENTSINPSIVANSAQEFDQFTTPERLPAAVSCSIHPWMSAKLVILDHPYVAVTDEHGHFEIKDLPAGKWEFSVWQEKAGYVSEVTWQGKSTEWRKGRFEFTVKPEENDMGEIEVAASLFEK